jgi:hypothetical protein
MAHTALWLASMALFGVGAAALEVWRVRRTSQLERARARARRAPERPVAALRAGDEARVVGHVEYAEPPLTAPLSGRRCCHYELRVGSLAAGTRLATHVERASQPFFLRDATGRVGVDPRDAALLDVVLDLRFIARELDAEARFELERVLHASGDPRALALLERRDELYFVEGAFEEGELVCAHGRATRSEPSGAGLGYRDRASALALEAPPGGLLFLSDSLPYA